MNYSFSDIIAGIISALIASMGLGGGGVYIMYLTLVKGTDQLSAQGINLMFFIPCSVVALIIYSKSKMIKIKSVLPMILGGISGALIGNFILPKIPQPILRMVFAVFLIVMGLYTVFSKSENPKEEK